ncbi:MAG: hypothetical protein JSU72_07025 [Deltaproteobacteria bacterium]|nr:MAG: hypothetical protein JSU72_07025 [Deltaproteobacteria bacterium]
MSFGATEETPGKHFHFKIRVNGLVISVDKDQRPIFGESPVKSTLMLQTYTKNKPGTVRELRLELPLPVVAATPKIEDYAKWYRIVDTPFVSTYSAAGPGREGQERKRVVSSE